MDLTVKDISTLLLQPEKEINRLIRNKEIPFHNINDRIVFNNQQIIEWALAKNLPLNISGHKKMSEYHVETLKPLLGHNSFFYNCNFSSGTYIKQMVSLIDIDSEANRNIIVQLLQKREELMSTAIGNGISLPHPRIPLMIGKNKPVLNFFFPQKPIELNAVDGKPVHTLILLISQSLKQHLSLLAHVSFLLQKESFRFALENRLDYKEIISIIDHIENKRNS